MPLNLENTAGIKSFLAGVTEDSSLPQVDPCTAVTFIHSHVCSSPTQG